MQEAKEAEKAFILENGPVKNGTVENETVESETVENGTDDAEDEENLEAEEVEEENLDDDSLVMPFFYPLSPCHPLSPCLYHFSPSFLPSSITLTISPFNSCWFHFPWTITK